MQKKKNMRNPSDKHNFSVGEQKQEPLGKSDPAIPSELPFAYSVGLSILFYSYLFLLVAERKS